MLRRFVFHPLLLAAYPVLFLVAQNLEEQVTLRSAAPTLAAVVVATAAVFFLVAAALRSAGRAGVLTSLYVFLLFSFGHIETIFQGARLVLVIAWIVAAIVGTVLIVRAKSDMPGATMALNSVSLVLVVMNLIPILSYRPAVVAESAPRSRDLELPVPGEVEDADKRDIYYLIFDRYARHDVLRDMYDFDNTPFLDSLERRGFYVADSVGNHQRTAHSLASSLNLTYLNYLEERHPDSGDYGPVYRMLKDFKVGAFLRSLGYTHHHLGSWWNPTETGPTADVNHTYDETVSEFSGVLVDSTLWPAVLDVLNLGDRGRTHRERVKFQFREIAEIAEDPGPTFTFAHFLVPHPPYVFNRDGSPVTEADIKSRTRKETYLEQLIYTNDQISKLVDALIDGGEDDPIVVIQSDEGPHPPGFIRNKYGFDWWEATDAELREKLQILNLYYLPGGHDDKLYRTISPVNTFRLIFNEYFGTDLRLAEDRTFIWRSLEDLYDFKEVTDRLYPQDAAKRSR